MEVEQYQSGIDSLMMRFLIQYYHLHPDFQMGLIDG